MDDVPTNIIIIKKIGIPQDRMVENEIQQKKYTYTVHRYMLHRNSTFHCPKPRYCKTSRHGYLVLSQNILCR